MDNRRLFLAAFLSLGLVILWGRFVQPPVASPELNNPAEALPPIESSPGSERPVVSGAQASPTEGSAVAPDVLDGGSTNGLLGSSATSASVAVPTIVAAIEEEVVVDSARFRAVLSNRGAQLQSFSLSRELDAEGQPLELVRTRGEKDPYPFAIVDGAGTSVFSDDLFVVERVGGSGGAVELTFEFQDQGRRARKRFAFEPNGLINVEMEVDGVTGWRVLLGPGVLDLGEEEMKNRLRQPTATYLSGDDVEKVSPSRQRESEVLPTAGLRWASLEDNYFLAALVPAAGVAGVEIQPLRQHVTTPNDGRRFVSIAESEGFEGEELSKVQELLVLPGGDSVSFISYFGAKRYQELSSLPYGLEESVRWGFFGFLARPLYYGLRWIHERVPNYGWAIVLMTILIKLVFFPLTHKGQKSMARMQELSPKVQQIRTKYRSKLRDKQGRPNREAQAAMNEEMMTLYRKEGVNPAGGCVPMLIQIPVFFAFFRLLQSAVELRNAPWIGWVDNLAAPDPIFILPGMMLVTSILLQKVTPAPPDPMQRRIVQMMPIIFSAVSITFPAGLVLYWTTNNVLTMVQQWFYHRSRGKEEKKPSTSSKGRSDRSASSK